MKDDGLEWWQMPESTLQWAAERDSKYKAEQKQKTDLRKSQDSIKKRLITQRMVRCEQCGKRGPVDLHHIVPLSEGGSWEDDNLTLICKTCHLQAHGYKK